MAARSIAAVSPESRSCSTWRARAVHWAAEDFLEGLLVFIHARQRGHGGIQAGLAHFDRIDDRERRLVLERLRAAIPELRLAVESVQNGRSVSLARTAVNTYRH